MSKVSPIRPYVPPIVPMPPWARYTTIDADGTCTAWENMPFIAYRQWVPDNIGQRFAIIGTNPPMRAFWETSLTPVHSPTVPTSRSFADGEARAQLRRVILILSALLAGLAWWAVSP